MGPLEQEVRERLSKTPFDAELEGRIRAGAGVGNGETGAGVSAGELFAAIFRVLTELEDIAVRLAAEIDALKQQQDPPSS